MRKSRFFFWASLSLIIFGVYFSIGTLYFDNSEYSAQRMLLLLISDVSLLFVSVAFVCFFIGSDFSNRTICNEIRIGYSRLSVILSRTIVVLPFAILMQLFYISLVVLMHGIVNEFGFDMTVQALILRFALFIVQSAAVLSITVFVTFWCKKVSLSMALNISFVFLFFNLMRGSPLSNNRVYRITIFYRFIMISQDLSLLDIVISFLSAIATILCALVATHIVLHKAEIK